MSSTPVSNSHLLSGSKVLGTRIADTPVLVVFGPKHIRRIVTDDEQMRPIYLPEAELRQLEITLIEQELLSNVPPPL